MFTLYSIAAAWALLQGINAAPLALNETLLDIRATPDGTKANPYVRAIDASNTEAEYHGIRELWDADCYAHVCQGVQVLLNRWTNPNNYNRGVANGNGVASRPIFRDLAKYGTTRPGPEYTSPEEWPPASARQGGVFARLFPVTTEAQNRQATLLSAFYSKSPTILAQNGLNGDTAGSWFRFREFTGAVGPYCVALNKRLADYDNNFDANGILLVGKVPDICRTGTPINLNGLAYDVGHYCYARRKSTDPMYQQQGKR